MTLEQQVVYLAAMSLDEKNDYMDALYAESEALLGKNNGLTYQQLVDRDNIFDEKNQRLNGEALRKRIQRRRQAQERLGIDLAAVILNRQQQSIADDDQYEVEEEDEFDFTEVGGNKFVTTFKPPMAQTNTSVPVAEDEEDPKTIADVVAARAGVSKDELFTMFKQFMGGMALEEVYKQDAKERQKPRIQPVGSFATGDSRRAMYHEADKSLDDTPLWESYLTDLARKVDMASVIVLSDMHIPDHSVPAMKLALNIIKLVKPHIILYAGDEFDFDAFSSFAKDPHRRSHDPFDEIEEDWHSFNDVVDEISPDSVRAFFTGNHEKPRIDRWGAASGNPFMGRNERDFVNLVRSRKRVWYLYGKQETYIGDWFIQHGKKTGETAAKSTARQLALYGSSSMGHTHNPGMFYTRSNVARYRGQHYHLQTNAQAGCLCNIPPHYNTDSNFATWINGILLGHVSLHTPEVNLQNIVFHPMLDENAQPANKMWTMVGHVKVTSD